MIKLIKIIIILFTCLVLCGQVHSQTVSILIPSDSIHVYWNSSPPDYPEEIITYDLIICYLDSSKIFTYTTISDTFININMTTYPDGIYRLGLSASDNAGNKSGILWSNSTTNPTPVLIRKDSNSPTLKYIKIDY